MEPKTSPKQIGTKEVLIDGKMHTVRVFAPGTSGDENVRWGKNRTPVRWGHNQAKGKQVVDLATAPDTVVTVHNMAGAVVDEKNTLLPDGSPRGWKNVPDGHGPDRGHDEVLDS